MSRAVPVDAAFDPLPSLAWLDSMAIDVAAAVPAEATAVSYGITTDGPVADALGLDREALTRLGFSGALGETLVVPDSSGVVTVAVGIGPSAEVDADRVRDAAAAFARAVPAHTRLVAVVRQDAPAATAQSIVEGVLLARYRYDALKSSPSPGALEALTIVATNRREASKGIAVGRTMARATVIARDLANTPPAHLTAEKIADLALARGPERGLEVEVYDRDQLLELGCGGIIGVNGGSADPPRMVKMSYRPARAGKRAPLLALVGKGVMYDSGGISLKPSDAVHATMKNDMSGAAAVFAAMMVLAELKCPTPVTAWLMCTDNMPSGTALKLGDVMTIRGGKTVEVINTDAEGRLIMADALVLAAEESPAAIVDIATLTGACMLALGTQVAGVMSNNQNLVEQVRAASARVDESTWQLPLERRYRRLLNSDVADMKNLGGAVGGAITAALFLAEFVGETPWAHIDIAGTAQVDVPGGWRTEGCSGFGARLLADLAMNFARPS
jgi:leucyl aminopeptidase